MADDRLDDAIDAVVRAVDRIERATRAAAPIPATAPLADATRPVQGAAGTTSAFWAPRPDQGDTGAFAPPGQAPNYGPAGQTGAFEPGFPQGAPQPAPGTTGGFDVGSGLGAGRGQRPQSTAEFSALGAAAMRPFAEHGASPEVHELVGRIVGRMQALEDNLEAASQLRAEISELVARLAAAAGKPR